MLHNFLTIVQMLHDLAWHTHSASTLRLEAPHSLCRLAEDTVGSWWPLHEQALTAFPTNTESFYVDFVLAAHFSHEMEPRWLVWKTCHCGRAKGLDFLWRLPVLFVHHNHNNHKHCSARSSNLKLGSFRPRFIVENVDSQLYCVSQYVPVHSWHRQISNI